MSGRSSLVLLSFLGLSCARTELPPPEDPAPSTVEAEPVLADEPAPSAVEDDPLDELRSDPTETTPRPEPIEVVVDAVMTESQPDATLIEVGADARFTIDVRIEKVDPETPLLPPGPYAVRIHSPSKTFRGPTPRKGKKVRFHMTIFPEDPGDPHDETFFADLWID